MTRRSDNPFRKSLGDWIILFVGFGTLAFAAVVLLNDRPWHLGRDAATPAAADVPLPASATASPTLQRAATMLAPGVTLQGQPGDTIVFECSGAPRSFSDRRCAANARVRVVETSKLNVYQAAPTPELVPTPYRGDSISATPPPPAVTTGERQRSALAQADPTRAMICATIEQQIDQINARMRQGYRSAQGEYYRAQLDTLSNQRHAAHCRGY